MFRIKKKKETLIKVEKLPHEIFPEILDWKIGDQFKVNYHHILFHLKGINEKYLYLEDPYSYEITKYSLIKNHHGAYRKIDGDCITFDKLENVSLLERNKSANTKKYKKEIDINTFYQDFLKAYQEIK